MLNWCFINITTSDTITETMTHPEVAAIAAIAQHSSERKRMPHIFAGMMKLYDGTELPYSTHIVSDSWASEHDRRGI